MWKISIQYMVLGFKPTSFRTWVSSHNHHSSKNCQRKFHIKFVNVLPVTKIVLTVIDTINTNWSQWDSRGVNYNCRPFIRLTTIGVPMCVETVLSKLESWTNIYYLLASFFLNLIESTLLTLSSIFVGRVQFKIENKEVPKIWVPVVTGHYSNLSSML